MPTDFTARQLADIEAFFALADRQTLCRANLQMVNDLPPVADARHDEDDDGASCRQFCGTAQAATASLPKPRTYADLTPADEAKLARLLGVDPATLN